MNGIKILSTGSYVPEFRVTNEDFSKYIETSDEWIKTRTGISARHMNIGSLNYKMAIKAATQAIERSELSPEEIDMIIVSTCTPDFFYPSVSCLVQNATGCANASCVDVNSACTGFITALDMAKRYLDDHKNILIIASEMLTPHMDFYDRTSCVLFGDGAGAMLITGSDKHFYAFTGAKGDPFKALFCRVTYNNNNPFEIDNPELDALLDTEEKKKHLFMDGKGVYKFAVDAMPFAVKTLCERHNLKVEDFDYIIPHQANLRIIQTAVKAMGVAPEKVYVNIAETANISSACIPLAIDEMFVKGLLKEGMKICLVGFGAGLTYGAVYLEL